MFFGERWITSIFDLFERSIRYFPTLLAETTDEDPMAKLEAGEGPELAELRLHNGTVYRWNRPIYDIPGGGVPHLRVENRVLPAGPTIVDVLANAAFYYGAIRMLAHEDRPVWTKMSFAACEENFNRATPATASTRTCTGPGSVALGGRADVASPAAAGARGPSPVGVSDAVRERFLGVIEGALHHRRQRSGVVHQGGRGLRGGWLHPQRGAEPDA